MHKIIKKIGSKTPVLHTLLQHRSELVHDNGILQLEKGYLEADIRELLSITENPRNFLAQHHIKGHGIEIGAAQLPVKLPKKASVKYVDIFTADELRKAWPQDYMKLDIVEIDVVDDAEKLSKFKTNSLDFIIANHFLEHCLDPIGTLINMTKKLRKDGVLFFAIPDKRYTFDKDRKITPYSHLEAEYKDKDKSFLVEHTEDFVKLGEKHKGNINKRVKELIDSEYRIHYHVWTQNEMYELFTRASHDFSLKLEITAMVKNGHEVIFILKKG